MKNPSKNARCANYTRWSVVVLFAIAMAWVEAAVVLYLRTLTNRIDPYQPNPLPEFGGLELPEMTREGATLLMLLAVGWLAGRTWRVRLAYALIAFGVWDIFYYVFLKVLTGWPHGLGDWDILFLLPLPWWGPVLAPICISLLMILWGTLVSQSEISNGGSGHNLRVLAANSAGAAVALYVFMADAIRVAVNGRQALRAVLPVSFNWPLFLFALLLMAVPVVDLLWQNITRKRSMALAFATLSQETGSKGESQS